jgi:hypothetical protein
MTRPLWLMQKTYEPTPHCKVPTVISEAINFASGAPWWPLAQFSPLTHFVRTHYADKVLRGDVHAHHANQAAFGALSKLHSITVLLYRESRQLIWRPYRLC